MTDALLVVDMQNLFVELVGEDSTRVLAEVNALVRHYANRASPIFYTRDYAPVDLPEGDPQRRTALHAGLEVRGTVVDKGPGKQGGFSGFVHAPLRQPQQGDGIGSLGALAGLLRRSQASSVTVVGIATEICVASTARDAVRLGYAVTVPLAATSPAFERADDSTAVRELRAAGVRVLSSPAPTAGAVA